MWLDCLGCCLCGRRLYAALALVHFAELRAHLTEFSHGRIVSHGEVVRVSFVVAVAAEADDVVDPVRSLPSAAPVFVMAVEWFEVTAQKAFVLLPLPDDGAVMAVHVFDQSLQLARFVGADGDADGTLVRTAGAIDEPVPIASDDSVAGDLLSVLVRHLFALSECQRTVCALG